MDIYCLFQAFNIFYIQAIKLQPVPISFCYKYPLQKFIEFFYLRTMVESQIEYICIINRKVIKIVIKLLIIN